MILGLHGKMGAGKNETARRLAVLSPLPVVEISYARRLKESVSALFDISLETIETWKNDADVYVTIAVLGDFIPKLYPIRSGGQSFRSFLQRYGTEAHREVFGQDFWLDAAMPLDRDYSDALYVVTDVRFQNEADRVRSLGGSIIRIVGPETDTGTHVSEQTLDCDYALVNTNRNDEFLQLDRHLSILLEDAFDMELLPGGVSARQ